MVKNNDAGEGSSKEVQVVQSSLDVARQLQQDKKRSTSPELEKQFPTQKLFERFSEIAEEKSREYPEYKDEIGKDATRIRAGLEERYSKDSTLPMDDASVALNEAVKQLEAPVPIVSKQEIFTRFSRITDGMTQDNPKYTHRISQVANDIRAELQKRLEGKENFTGDEAIIIVREAKLDLEKLPFKVSRRDILGSFEQARENESEQYLKMAGENKRESKKYLKMAGRIDKEAKRILPYLNEQLDNVPALKVAEIRDAVIELAKKEVRSIKRIKDGPRTSKEQIIERLMKKTVDILDEQDERGEGGVNPFTDDASSVVGDNASSHESVDPFADDDSSSVGDDASSHKSVNPFVGKDERDPFADDDSSVVDHPRNSSDGKQ